jgi:hypothetical protein
MIRWPWRRESISTESKQTVNLRTRELQTAKETLAEVFHARQGDVEEMIRIRLEEKSWTEESEEGLLG